MRAHFNGIICSCDVWGRYVCSCLARRFTILITHCLASQLQDELEDLLKLFSIEFLLHLGGKATSDQYVTAAADSPVCT